MTRLAGRMGVPKLSRITVRDLGSLSSTMNVSPSPPSLHRVVDVSLTEGEFGDPGVQGTVVAVLDGDMGREGSVPGVQGTVAASLMGVAAIVGAVPGVQICVDALLIARQVVL